MILPIWYYIADMELNCQYGMILPIRYYMVHSSHMHGTA